MQGREMTPLLTQDFLKDTVMKYSSCVLLVFAVLLPFSAYAVVGICENDDGDIAVSIMTNNDGQLIDLAVTVGEKYISRFPEANMTKMDLSSRRYRFSTSKTALHDALEIDISGTTGKMKYRGRTFGIECTW